MALKIDLFNHFFPQRFWDEFLSFSSGLKDMGKRVKNIPAIYDLEARFRTMDQFDEYTQLLSLGSPPVEGLFNAEKAPEGFPISQIVNLFKPSSTNSNSARNDRMKTQNTKDSSDVWRVLCVEGMWLQDLFNYDFRRTEMCVIPYGTQEGEISFCAYNTGVGWRQII